MVALAEAGVRELEAADSAEVEGLTEAAAGQAKKIKDLEVVADSLPQYKEIQSGLYNHRNKSIPLIPASRADIKLQGEWILCEDGSRF